jgi:hypothetical protein
MAETRFTDDMTCTITDCPTCGRPIRRNRDGSLRPHLADLRMDDPTADPWAKCAGERRCRWCGCLGYHAEVCEGFSVNDPGQAATP